MKRALFTLLLLALPSLVSAQGPLTMRAEQMVTAYAATDAARPAGDTLDDAVSDPRWLRFSEGLFVAGELADAVSSYVMLRKTDASGARLYEEANPLMPNGPAGVLAVKMAATAGGIAAAEVLWAQGRKWQAVAVLGGAAVISFAAAGNNVYQAVRPK